MLGATLTLTGLDVLAEGVDHAVDAGLGQVGERVAQEARTNHPYQNRSGDLQASTQALEPSGRATDGTARVDVVALEDYASYLEDRPEFAFLAPAFERLEPQLGALLDQYVAQGVRRAGG